jgi:hypothetical protein
MNPQAFAKSSLLGMLLVLAALLTAAFATVKQADGLLARALAGAFGEHRSEYESVWFDWSGNITARNAVLRPDDPRDASELRFDRVWLETPGWTFFLRHAFDRDLRGARFARLHLVFHDALQTSGFETLLPEFGPLGPASGAMFEAEGCPASRRFSREQLAGMGLSIGPTTLELDARIDGDAIGEVYVLETPGSSRTQLERSGRLEAPRASLLDTRLAARIESEHWRVRDQGFVLARNRHCARQAGIDPREFPERHIEAIDRSLQRAGLAVDDNARAFYRRFARSGGEMSFGGSYRPALATDALPEGRADGRALARMDASLERDTRAVPVVWEQVPVVRTPEPEQRKSRDATAAPVATPAPAPRVPPPLAPAAPPTVPEKPRVAPPPANGGRSSQTPAPPLLNSLPPGPANETTPAERVPVPAVSTPRPTTPPPKAAPARPAGPRIERAPPVMRRETLAWEDLARHRGRLVRLWTVHNPPRTVQLLELEGDTARVRAKLGGGVAEYTVRRSGFIKATLIQ